MDKKKRKKIIVSVLLFAFIVAMVYYNITAVKQGEIDYSLMLDGKQPLYAKEFARWADGGTALYNGNGYIIYELHSIHEENGVYGHLVGPRIRYSLLVLAGKDKESLHFEAEAKENPGD